MITLVLPEPGPARTSWWPQVVTAVVWEGLRDIEQYLVRKTVIPFEKWLGNLAIDHLLPIARDVSFSAEQSVVE